MSSYLRGTVSLKCNMFCSSIALLAFKASCFTICFVPVCLRNVKNCHCFLLFWVTGLKTSSQLLWVGYMRVHSKYYSNINQQNVQINKRYISDCLRI